MTLNYLLWLLCITGPHVVVVLLNCTSDLSTERVSVNHNLQVPICYGTKHARPALKRQLFFAVVRVCKEWQKLSSLF